MKYKYHLLPSFIFLLILAGVWLTYPEPADCPKCDCTEEIIEIPVTGTYSFEYDPCTGLVRHSEEWVEPRQFESRRIQAMKSK